MENTVTLQELFNNAVFRIPQYQRAYSWEPEPHLSAFLDDLRQQVIAQKDQEKKQYYLGTFLLHKIQQKSIKEYHIVDGQQRLTTSVIFISTAVKLYEQNEINLSNSVKLYKRAFVFDSDLDMQKFHTIEEDEPFFRSNILNINTAMSPSVDSPSSRNLEKASAYFQKNIEKDEWENLLSVLVNSQAMEYVVDNSADATQIFELQNDRGKKLTDLESLKSYLMHLIYINAVNPDDHLSSIQVFFSKIFRSIESIGNSLYKKVPSEDAILSYHCVGYLDWKGDEWRNPKNLVKKIIKTLDKNQITTWIENFTSSLAETFNTVYVLINKIDELKEFSELIILDRMATFWPLVIKTWRTDKTQDKNEFKLVCRMMEVYAFRGYGISNLRSDAGLSSLYRIAKQFKDDFKVVNTHLSSMSICWYDISNRFNNGLARSNLYRGNRKDAQYLLWKYENYLRSKRGQSTPEISWRDYLFPSTQAKRLSIEHIAAEKNPISDTTVEWDKDDKQKFCEVATHRIGNLVLDSISSNSKKGKYDFTDKLESLSKNSTYLSQGELINWSIKNDKNIPYWTVDSIKNRQKHIIDFALDMWDPNKYFKSDPKDIVLEEQVEDDTNEGS